MCPVCHKVSITFDPFNCIQLELPQHNERVIQVILVRCQRAKEEAVADIGQRCAVYSVVVDMKANIRDLKRALSSQMLRLKKNGDEAEEVLEAESMLLTDVYESVIYAIPKYVILTFFVFTKCIC